MLVQCSILESRLKVLVESQLKALQSSGPAAGTWQYAIKSIFATVTCPCDNFRSYVETIRANTETIMAMMNFGGSGYLPGAVAGFGYDFDAYPAFDIANGTFGSGSLDLTPNSALYADFFFLAAGTNPSSPGEAKSGLDAAKKYIRITWFYFPDKTVGTTAFIRNDMASWRYFWLGLPTQLFSATKTVTPPADTNTPTYGSVFKVPLPDYQLILGPVPGYGGPVFFASLQQINDLVYTGGPSAPPVIGVGDPGNAGDPNTNAGGNDDGANL